MQKVPETPGPLRDNDLQPDDVVLNQQQPVPPKGNQDEQSRSGADRSEELEDEEMEDEQVDDLLEEEHITDEDINPAFPEEDDAEKGPMK